jgi:hypothetical protein
MHALMLIRAERARRIISTRTESLSTGNRQTAPVVVHMHGRHRLGPR